MITLKMTLPAIEKILKDDNGEIKTEISNQILDSFAKKHLKSLLNDEKIKKLREEINLSINDEIGKIFGTKSSRFPYNFELNKEIKELIKTHSTKILFQTISENTDDFKKSIESKLNYEFTKITKKISKIEEDFEIKINSLTKELEDEKALNDRLRKLIREELSSLFQK